MLIKIISTIRNSFLTIFYQRAGANSRKTKEPRKQIDPKLTSSFVKTLHEEKKKKYCSGN